MGKLTFILLVLVIGCSEAKIKKKKAITTRDKGAITQIKSQESERGTITEINWYSSIEEAKNKGSFTNLPLMIDFYASWCIWCRRLDEITFKDKDVIRESLNFIPIRIDCTKDRSPALEYKVWGFPTIIFIGTSGTRYDVIGFRGPKDFLLEMKKAKEKLNTP